MTSDAVEVHSVDEQTDRERWIEAQVAKRPAWTPERIVRLAEALGYVHKMSTDSTGKGR